VASQTGGKTGVKTGTKHRLLAGKAINVQTRMVWG
jgi:hypothetical protein